MTKFCTNRCRGSPWTRASKRGTPEKDVILLLLAWLVWKRLQIGTDMLLVVTSTDDRLFRRFINVDDPERPWTPNRGFLVNFLASSVCVRHLRVNCAKMAGDGPGQPVYDIFSIEHAFLRILSFNILNSRSLSYGGLKFKYSFKTH